MATLPNKPSGARNVMPLTANTAGGQRCLADRDQLHLTVPGLRNKPCYLEVHHAHQFTGVSLVDGCFSRTGRTWVLVQTLEPSRRQTCSSTFSCSLPHPVCIWWPVKLSELIPKQTSSCFREYFCPDSGKDGKNLLCKKSLIENWLHQILVCMVWMLLLKLLLLLLWQII